MAPDVPGLLPVTEKDISAEEYLLVCQPRPPVSWKSASECLPGLDPGLLQNVLQANRYSAPPLALISEIHRLEVSPALSLPL